MNKKIIFLLCFLCSAVAVLHAQNILENTQVRFFANTGYFAERDSTHRSTHTFNIGNVEMLLTSQVTDRISVLAEPVFTPSGLTIERLMFSYYYKDYLKLSAGKLYSPVGIWNTRFYHHVKALTPTINQPVIIAEQDEFGILDNNDTGVQLSGENITKLRFGYKLLLGNGFATTKYSDKTVTANVYIEPVDNLQFAISARRDNLAPGTITPRGETLTEYNKIYLLNASIMYYGADRFEFASEFYKIDVSTTSTSTKQLLSGFAYAGYRLGKFTPYLLYNKVNFDQGIAWFLVNNFTGSTLGVRYNFSALSVLKLECQFLESTEFKKLNRVGLQWAIGF
ncbi:MAG TPA: hypothetical protein VL443_17150 [Cyclobacteriaceae bacterium]|jgi:hypothetical protein|nr:hypothetical protein [Cyclobacteriaceae bacterium]